MTTIGINPIVAVSGIPRDFIIMALCALPAWFFAATHSRWLVPYLIVTWAVGPEVRRLNDWMTGGFQSITLVSLIPMAATAALLLPILETPLRASKRIKIGMNLVLLSLVYGTLVGLAINGVSAVFEGTGRLLPFLFVPYALSRPYKAEERDAWLRGLSTVSVFVAVYGWYQYLRLPPWDMQWLVGSGMYGIKGEVVAGSFRVFSTLNSDGPLGLYMAAALVVGLCNRRWRGPFGLLGSLVIGSCLLLSGIRVGWFMFAIAVTTFIVVQGKSNRLASLVTVLGVSMAVVFVTPYLPGAQGISTRLSTLDDLGKDSSLQGREAQTMDALTSIAMHPLGMGFGATGIGGKLTSSEGGNGGADNGYVDLATTLGPLISIAFLAGFVRLGLEPYRLIKRPAVRGTPQPPGLDKHAALAVAMLAAYAAGTIIYNNFGGIGGVMVWMAIACPMGRQARQVAGATRPLSKTISAPTGESRRQLYGI
jgi:hypothetical protein